MVTVKIYYVPFPESCRGAVKGMCQQLSADRFRILIDSSLTELQQRESLAHEKAHIYLFHFDSDLPIEELENEADEIAGLLTRNQS